MITKMSDMTRRFEVILTSFSSDEWNGQFKFKIKCLFITSANDRFLALKSARIVDICG